MKRKNYVWLLSAWRRTQIIGLSFGATRPRTWEDFTSVLSLRFGGRERSTVYEKLEVI